MTHPTYLLGVDGGGSKTVAWLTPETGADGETVSAPLVARTGASHVASVGFEESTGAVEAAVQQVRAEVSPDSEIRAACFALSGSAQARSKERWREWIATRNWTPLFAVVPDAVAPLICASPKGEGVALVSGTGSCALSHSSNGCFRAGGFGPLLGDEGSGFDVGLKALQEVMRALDGRGPGTELAELFTQHASLQDPRELATHYGNPLRQRQEIAALVPVVHVGVERGDDVAMGLIEQAGLELGNLVGCVARKAELKARRYRLAMAGGVLLSSQPLRNQVLQSLDAAGIPPESSMLVREPVEGCLRIARMLADKQWDESHWKI